MTLGEIVNGVIALATIAAVIVAIVQVRHVLRDRSDARAAEVDGVAVQWFPTVRPNHPDADGTGTWKYEITARNPGGLPIRDVAVELHFTLDVVRRHHDKAVDPPQRSLLLVQPIILGGGSRTWQRLLMIEFSDRQKLESSTADITFSTLRGERRTNHMDGRPPTIHEKAGPA